VASSRREFVRDALAGATALLAPDAVLAARPEQQERPMREARGEFDVKMTPQSEDKAPGSTLGRMSLEKTFRGDLAGEGRGEMLTALTDVPGSAVYVAVERVTGTLHGRSGTFALSHRGTMTRGAQSLSIGVVPDSGTGELAGIEGDLAIEIRDRKHYYTLTYRLPG
jgi:Protein of unknown function (DUF3224)